MADRRSQLVGPLVLAFAGLGGTAAVIPAVLPTAASRFPADSGGYLQAVPAVFTGLLLGVLLSAVATKGSSTRAVVALGSLLQAGALVVLLTMPPVLGFLLAAGSAGLGFGLVEAAGSALARESAAASVTRLLAVLTGTVALVAATCPLIVAFLPVPGAPSIALALVAGIHLSTVVSLGVTARSSRRPFGADRADERGHEAAPSTAADRSRHVDVERVVFPLRELGAIAAALALYVGVESVFSGWSAVIAADQLATDTQRSAVGTSAFWILMATGRFAAWRMLRSRTAGIRHPLIAVTGGAVLLLIAAAASGPAAGIALCGAVVLLGPCYALILGIGLSRVTVADAARVTGPLVACGAIGGAGIPSLMLAVTDSPTGRAVPLLGALLLLLAGVLLLLPRQPADLSGGGDRRLSEDTR